MDALLHNLHRAAARAAEAAAETLWPTRCALCDKPGDVLCGRCAALLRPVDACLACPACGAPYGRIQCTECALPTAGEADTPFSSAAFAVVADEAARRLVKVYKDQGERRLARAIAERCARQISPDRLREGCAVTFIPATAEARRRRGFDHGRELACLTAEAAGLDCVGLLDRPSSADQRGLGRAERASNMAGALRVHEGAPVPPTLIVFDDICTTGATLAAAGTALAAAGARSLHALAFGRVLG